MVPSQLPKSGSEEIFSLLVECVGDDSVAIVVGVGEDNCGVVGVGEEANCEVVVVVGERARTKSNLNPNAV